VPGHAQLANEEHVERGVERTGDLERDRHAATRQAEHDHVVAAGVLAEPLGELAAGVPPVPEPLHGRLAQVLDEPLAGQGRHALECARLLEQVPGARHDHEPGLTAQQALGEAVELDHVGVLLPHDQQRRRGDARECVAREVRSAAA
jgi:hypothetical protein